MTRSRGACSTQRGRAPRGNTRLTFAALPVALAAAALLSGCAEGFAMKNPFGGAGASASGTSPASTSVRLVDRDVEAPEVFQTSSQGLWDGRPSLGGVWVAYPDVANPERVIIRNPANGKFVIGALFRRERDMPGPKLQVSSDAAGALGMLAGQPADLQVTALRRDEGKATAAAEPATGPGLSTAEPIATSPAAPAAGAAPAAAPSAAAAPKPVTGAPQAAARTAAPPAAAPPAAPAATTTAATAPGKAFVQIGIFSVEANAERAADQMRKAGLTPEIRRENSQGKTFWRVVVGPLATAADRSAAIAKVKGIGYPDAYAVSK